VAYDGIFSITHNCSPPLRLPARVVPLIAVYKSNSRAKISNSL